VPSELIRIRWPPCSVTIAALISATCPPGLFVVAGACTTVHHVETECGAEHHPERVNAYSACRPSSAQRTNGGPISPFRHDGGMSGEAHHLIQSEVV
jgi:hypothetical protein